MTFLLNWAGLLTNWMLCKSPTQKLLSSKWHGRRCCLVCWKPSQQIETCLCQSKFLKFLTSSSRTRQRVIFGCLCYLCSKLTYFFVYQRLEPETSATSAPSTTTRTLDLRLFMVCLTGSCSCWMFHSWMMDRVGDTAWSLMRVRCQN